MKTETFLCGTRIDASAEEIREGAQVRLRVRLGFISLPWVARIERCVPGRSFRDIQVRGPFAPWEHEHRMVPAGRASCWLEDHVPGRVRGWEWGGGGCGDGWGS